jgi:hypothetical protein
MFAGCDKDTMEDINEYKNNPSDVPSKLLVTDIITRTAFTISGSDLAFYASVYSEYNVGIYNQMYNAEIRAGEPISSTTYNNMWGAAYENLYNLKIVMGKTSEGGAEAGNFQTLGIAQILTAYNVGMLTDLFGDVPYSEALQPGVIFQPVLDKQQDLYTEIFRLLNEGIANLGRETEYPSIGGQDLLFGGDSDMWIKFANGLKARHTALLALRNPNWQDVITFADLSFAEGENAAFEYDGAQTANPFYTFFTDRDYFGASQSLHDKLIERNDPRDEVFFMPYPGTEELIFAPNGSPEQAQGVYGVSALMSVTNPTYLLSYHELQFLKAEAYARLDQVAPAQTAMENGIRAAFVKVGLTVEDADAYITAEVLPRFQANALSEIMNQKYLALYEEEAVQTYNDIRRMIALGEDFISLSNPLNAQSRFPVRYSYGADDVTTNLNVAGAYGDGSYVYNQPVWWAGGSR